MEQKTLEHKIYGLESCLALFHSRPDDIIRVYVTKERLGVCGELLRFCAKKKLAYHVVTAGELQVITESSHADGVCILAKALRPIPLAKALERIAAELPQCLLYLDGVSNPHNIGAILRTAAHFNVPYIFGLNLPARSSALMRVSKGGGEFAHLVETADPVLLTKSLRRLGYHIVACDQAATRNQLEPGRHLLVLGNEERGLTALKRDHFSSAVRIPGSGSIESLNVSVAAGILMAQSCQLQDRG